MAEEQQAQNQEAQPNGQQAAATSAATQNTEHQPQEQTVPYSRFKEVNDQLKALKDAADKATKERQAEDEKKLAEQAEWQKLYEGGKTQLAALEPKAELADKLSAMVMEQYQTEIKAWPEQVRAMAPADDADILTKLDWMKRAKPLATELMADKTPIPGNGVRPRPVGAAGSSKPAKVEPIVDVRRNF